MANGYLYAAREPGKSEVKIGRTRNDPNIRLGQLNNAGRLHNLKLEFVLAVKDEVQAEKIVHDKLNACRIRSNKEFFNCKPRKTRRAMLSAARNVGGFRLVLMNTCKTFGRILRFLLRVFGSIVLLIVVLSIVWFVLLP